MPKFIIVNKSEGQVHLELPPHVDAYWRNFTQVTIPHSMSLDIYPLVGSMDLCKKLARVRGLMDNNHISIEVEE